MDIQIGTSSKRERKNREYLFFYHTTCNSSLSRPEATTKKTRNRKSSVRSRVPTSWIGFQATTTVVRQRIEFYTLVRFKTSASAKYIHGYSDLKKLNFLNFSVLFLSNQLYIFYFNRSSLAAFGLQTPLENSSQQQSQVRNISVAI